MWVTFTPEGGDKRDWHFVADDVWEDDAEAIEKAAGVAWDQWRNELRRGASRARRSLLWHLLRQDHPGLRFEDLQRYRKGELVVEFDVAELQVMRQNFLDSPRLTEDERHDLVADVDKEIAKAREKFGEPGKAPSPGVAPPTSG
jgi:hypothetical protein